MLSTDFRRIELNRLLWCEVGGPASTVAVLRQRDLASDGPVEVLAVEDEESIAFRIPRRLIGLDDHPARAALVPQVVGRIVLQETKTTQLYREYRLRGAIVDGSAERGLVSVKFEPLILDLAKCGPIREVANGLNNFAFAFAEQTPAQILTDYAIALSGLAWLGIGTVDSSYVFASLEADRVTPLGLTQLVRDALRERDIPAEYRLRRNGTTNYLLDLRSQIGAGVSVAPFTIKAGQLGFRRTVDPSEQATRVFPVCGADPDGAAGTIGRARWTVANPTSTTFEVADPNGGPAPIAFDGQYAAPAAWYVYRVRTGETWQIVATVAGPPAVITVAGTGSLVAGEEVEFRATEPGTNTRRVAWSDTVASTQPTGIERRLFEVTAIDAVSSPPRLTLSRAWESGIPDSVDVDGQYDGFLARVSSLVSGGAVTASPDAAGDYYTLGSVTGYQVDDWLIAAISGSAPYLASNLSTLPIANVASIDGGNNRLHVTPRYRTGVDPVASAGAQNGTRIYRELGDLRVRATYASSNEVAVDSVAGIAVGDVVVLEQPDGAGELPVYIDHPTHAAAPPAGYGVHVTEIPKPLILGLQNIARGGYLRDWPGGDNDLPAPWSKTGAGTIVREQVITRLGPNSIYVGNWTSISRIQVGPIYPSYAPGRERVSVRVWLYFTTFVLNSPEQVLSIRVYRAGPDGLITGSSLSSLTLYAPGSPTGGSGPGHEHAELDTWMQAKIIGLELDDTRFHYGLAVEIIASALSSTPQCYIGGIDAYGHGDVTEEPVEFGDAHRGVQSANRHLREYAEPLDVDLMLLNLAAIDREGHAGRRLDTAIGGIIPAINREHGLNIERRIHRLELHHFHPERTTCATTRRSPGLTDVVL